jgi:aspartate racemase
MPLHIGIVACSAEGAALCYRTICEEGQAQLGPHRHPEVSMHTYSLGEYMDFIYRDDWRGVADLMLSSAEKLERSGAEFLICPDNTVHRSFARVAERSPLPWLHIVEVVAAEARRQGFRDLAITGTSYTMEGPVYPEVLSRSGIGFRIPLPGERAEINRIIFEELVNGVIRPESKAALRAVIGRMQSEGSDAVVLGCTELPLLVTPADSPLPVLDSTRLLAREALRRATGTPLRPQRPR